MQAFSNAITAVAVWLVVRMRTGDGQTMTEYAVLIAWLALAVVVGATTLGSSLAHAFSSTAARV